MGDDANWLQGWAKDYELCPETLAALAQKGFASKKTLSKLTADLIATEFKKLPLAQSLMLEEACESLQHPTVQGDAHTDVPAVTQGGLPAPAGAAGNQDGAQAVAGAAASSTQGLTAQEVANLIQQGSSVLSSDTQPGKPFLFDPLQFDSNCEKTTFKDIRDYISLVPKCSDSTPQAGCIQIGSQEFLLKDSKIPLELINVSQYMEGSLRILRDYALHENYSKEQIVAYTNYVIKIATLAQCFEWKSVLKYDQAYRRAQAETNFRWGADNSYFMQLYLKPESGNPTGNTVPPSTHTQRQNFKRTGTFPRQNKTRGKFDPSSGKPICIKWNGATGCNFRDCKYAHICMECYTSAHTQVQHSARAADSENA